MLKTDDRLAIHGGTPVVPTDMMQPWPPVEERDRELVLASLNGGAQKHCAWHTGMTMPLRPPNGPELAEKVAEAFCKVLAQAGDIKPDDILYSSSHYDRAQPGDSG